MGRAALHRSRVLGPDTDTLMQYHKAFGSIRAKQPCIKYETVQNFHRKYNEEKKHIFARYLPVYDNDNKCFNRVDAEEEGRGERGRGEGKGGRTEDVGVGEKGDREGGEEGDRDERRKV